MYKRNQVEQAIGAVLEGPAPVGPSALLRTRLKRLLETDRAFERSARSSDPEKSNYAFYSDNPPGRGVEVWFSEYEAFALLVAATLMKHEWPQGFVVRVLRRVRDGLEQEHVRILGKDPAVLFDQETIRRNARAGDMAFDTTDPVLLAIVSKGADIAGKDNEQINCTVARGASAAMNWARKQNKGTGVISMFEIGGLAHQLKRRLEGTEPSQRGRSA